MTQRRKRRFLRRRGNKEDMALQITSMADIFTILLVFLLKSFSTGVSNINISSKEMTLPIAVAKDEVHDVLKVEISSSMILVDDQPVTVLQNFKFDETDVENNGTCRSLNMALGKEKRTRVPASERPQVMILADQKTPFSTINAVLNSASSMGFTESKLAVVEDR